MVDSFVQTPSCAPKMVISVKAQVVTFVCTLPVNRISVSGRGISHGAVSGSGREESQEAECEEERGERHGRAPFCMQIIRGFSEFKPGRLEVRNRRCSFLATGGKDLSCVIFFTKAFVTK